MTGRIIEPIEINAFSKTVADPAVFGFLNQVYFQIIELNPSNDGKDKG